MGVPAPDGGVDSDGEFKLSFAFLWVDHKPCMERLSAFELCLDTCELAENLSRLNSAQISPFLAPS